jgi:hypothetical protein
MVPENKQDRKYKQINFIGLQTNRHSSQHTVTNFHKAAGARSGEFGGLLSVSRPEEHHVRRMFCRRGDNPSMCDSSSAIDS